MIKICGKDYKIEEKVDNLLSLLSSIKKYQNNALSFRSGCKSGVCGSCAVVVNGVEIQAKDKIKNGVIKIEPLHHLPVIKDLVVDLSSQDRFLIESKAFLEKKNNSNISINDEKKIDIATKCILCNSCFSSCPVYEVNQNFKGPFALTRVLRYIDDKKEIDIKNKIDMLYSIIRLSPKTKSNDIYITEVNWPILDTAPYAPTGEKECVSEDEYSKYMIEYFKITKESKKVSKVFWHQLIATGYGLVDIRDNKIRKRKAFYKFKEMLQNENRNIKNNK